MYITNRPDIALLAEAGGVDRIFIDLETLGKQERQGHIDSVKSKHSIADIYAVKSVLSVSELLVRVNPIHDTSHEEINAVIEAGADVIMLPMFTCKADVEQFITLVNGRTKTLLLLETKSAYENIDDILTCQGIDEVHVGLNDLHLCYKLDFMFELISNGVVEDICTKLKQQGIPYGFGGIGAIGYGLLPAEQILCEHCRLGSQAVILSRAFLNIQNDEVIDSENVAQHFKHSVQMIRRYESMYSSFNTDEFAYMHKAFNYNVDVVASRLRK